MSNGMLPTYAPAGSSNNVAFYPHSVNALGSMQPGFQSYYSPSSEVQAGEGKSFIMNRSQAEALGTPMKQNTSNFLPGNNASELSGTSPYRVINSAMPEAASSSPYSNMAAAEPAPAPAPAAQQPAASTYKPTSVDGASNVIYSAQPLTSADFGGMMMSSSGTYYQPMSSMGGYSSQMPMSFSYGGMGSSFPQSTSGFMSNSLTPRMMMGAGSQGYTPRGMPPSSITSSTMPLPNGTQMGLTPRSYQEQINATMMPGPLPSDMSLMMFADNFRNQCFAMAQYYESHPEEKEALSRESAEIEPSPAGALSKPERRRAGQHPHLATIQDHENNDTANVTPSGSESKKAAKKEDEEEIEESDTEDQAEETLDPSSTDRRPAKQSSMQMMVKKFGCGSKMACGAE